MVVGDSDRRGQPTGSRHFEAAEAASPTRPQI